MVLMGFRESNSFIKRLFAVFLASILLICTNIVHARSSSDYLANLSHLESISLADLPKQGQHVYALIEAGGPFAHEKDGVVFGNRERILPVHKRGFYREYTVKTSGVRHRGARRIVCGGYKMTNPEICYYTDDHYASFRIIKP